MKEGETGKMEEKRVRKKEVGNGRRGGRRESRRGGKEKVRAWGTGGCISAAEKFAHPVK